MNAQPMGFYPPSSLVRDAQRRGVEVRPPHVDRSEAECTIEDGAVRVGLGYVQSVGEADARTLEEGRPYAGLGDLARRASVKKDALESLVAAGACDHWGERRALLWQLGVTARGETVGGGNRQLALPLEPTTETPDLPAQTAWEQMLADYKHTSLSVGVHPLQLLRPHLPARVATSADLPETPNGTLIELAGMAVARQRPATANGVVFMLLEDEYGQANLIVPPPVYERYRAIVRGEPLLLARGKLERHGRNINLLVASLESLGPLARRQRARRRSSRRSRRRTTSATADGSVEPESCQETDGQRRTACRCDCARLLSASDIDPPPVSRRRPEAGCGKRCVARARMRRQVVGRVDEPDVRERLREVAEQPFRGRVVFLRDQAEVVAEREQPLEEPARLVAPPLHQERVDEPERAREEHAFAARETVDVVHAA